MALISVEQAIDDLRHGKMLVMVDDEDRENEGDIVFAATFSDVQKVNFAITHAKGVLCTPISEEIAKKLNLSPMVISNTSSHETAFTVSIDAKKATTGVSAYERDMTIKLMSSPLATPNDFVRPGHIFPLIAKKGGVLVRTGHTEGCVDLCKLAGLMEVAICCEIIKDDGNMARRDDLELFCNKFGLNMIAISDIVKYRLQNETLINIQKQSKTKLAGYNVVKYEIKDHLNRTHFAFIFGTLAKRSAVKFEKISSNVDFLLSKKYDELQKSLKILNEKNGILLFLNDGKESKNLIKDYGIGAQILKHFGITQIDIISSNSKKEFVGIKGFNLDVVSYIN